MIKKITKILITCLIFHVTNIFGVTEIELTHSQEKTAEEKISILEALLSRHFEIYVERKYGSHFIKLFNYHDSNVIYKLPLTQICNLLNEAIVEGRNQCYFPQQKKTLYFKLKKLKTINEKNLIINKLTQDELLGIMQRKVYEFSKIIDVTNQYLISDIKDKSDLEQKKIIIKYISLISNEGFLSLFENIQKKHGLEIEEIKKNRQDFLTCLLGADIKGLRIIIDSNLKLGKYIPLFETLKNVVNQLDSGKQEEQILEIIPFINIQSIKTKNSNKCCNIL